MRPRHRRTDAPAHSWALARRMVPVLAAAVVGASCGDGTGPTSGTAIVAMIGATPARSAQFRLVGAQSGLAASSADFRIFTSPIGQDTVMIAVVANTGHLLSEGNLVTVTVPDLGKVPQYSLTLLQVASPTYSLQNIGAYTLTITAQ